MNIYGKLLKARTMFLEVGTKKSGKNRAIMYDYFELEDIVPTVTKIFNEVGLVTVVSFSNEEASMTVVNTEEPSEQVVFTAPFKCPEPNKGTNITQTIGSGITYFRRYLYMMAMDIIEADSIDCTSASPKVEPAKTTPVKTVAPASKPATPIERKKIVETLANPEDLIDDAMKDVLIKKIAELLQKKPESKNVIVALKDKTNGFINIKKSEYPAILDTIVKMIGG